MWFYTKYIVKKRNNSADESTTEFGYVFPFCCWIPRGCCVLVYPPIKLMDVFYTAKSLLF